VALFMVAIPAASFVASPVSALLLQMDGIGGLRGWHWLFLLEGLPTVLLGVVCLFFLTDRPDQARWLNDAQRQWLVTTMDKEAASRTAKRHIPCGSCSASRMCGAWPWCAPARRPPVRC
jgi:MFS family permease